MKEIIEKAKYNLAVKRALKGEITGKDMIAIAKYQNKDLECEISDYDAAALALYQAMFN
jgi:hypothetical protein